MTKTIDSYIENVIKVGDEGSALLAAITAPTLNNSSFVEILSEGMNGLAVLRIPEDHYAVVHSVGGDPTITYPKLHAASLVDRLVAQAQALDAEPIAFANVVDSKLGSIPLIEDIGNALLERANHYKLVILNGENAILGDRVNCEVNMSGTMISIIPKDLIDAAIPIVNNQEGIYFAIFDPKGKAISMNSDGVGTKTEFYERLKQYTLALEDSLAMKLDDTIKFGARAVVVSDVVEMKGDIPFEELEVAAKRLGEQMGFIYMLQPENIGDRLLGYNASSPSYNISGTSVSVIDEERLQNPLIPSEGESLLRISFRPNPRSNGITARRNLMVHLFGANYHESELARPYLEFLATPSAVLYPMFQGLIDEGLATSVYHMSGGSFKGKLARPLAKHGLFVNMKNIPDLDEREKFLFQHSGVSTEDAYTMWPMHVDGFITTTRLQEAKKFISNNLGYEVADAGELEKRADGKTGIEFQAFNGVKIAFSGKEE